MKINDLLRIKPFRMQFVPYLYELFRAFCAFIEIIILGYVPQVLPGYICEFKGFISCLKSVPNIPVLFCSGCGCFTAQKQPFL
ncbi:MAG: hypothetical protein Q7J35_11560 [Candidatus Methanoperedens sp.]|nr:hypothetical protein [Candidatus Methanoperedens sp.]